MNVFSDATQSINLICGELFSYLAVVMTFDGKGVNLLLNFSALMIVKRW